MFYVSLMVPRKQKPIKSFTNDKGKGIRAYYSRKLPIHRGRQQKKKEKRELQSNQKAINHKTLVALNYQ